MTSLITGATGFIGQALLRHLVAGGESVIAVSRTAQAGEPGIPVRWCRLPDRAEGWSRLLDGVSTVYHLAWSSLPQTSNDDPVGDASENILGTLRLLEGAKRLSARPRIVFLSSGGTVYGTLSSIPAKEHDPTRPRCAYGVSKLAAEKYLTLYRDLWGLSCVSLRVSNAYGPGQKVGRNFGAISTFASCVAKGEPITIFGDGSIIRDYVYINDLTEAIVAAADYRGSAAVINIGSGVGKSLRDIVAELTKLSSRTIDVNYLAGRDVDVPVSILDISLAKAALKWKPRTSFEAGVRSTLNAVCRALAGG